MRLYLFRHGIAQDREDPTCPPEADRALTPKGQRRTRRAARGLRALGVQPAVIFTSPYLRSTETAEIVLRELRLDSDSLVRTDALLPEANPSEFLAELAHIEEQDVLVCGHRPNLDLLLARSLGVQDADLTTLTKAGGACVEFDGEGARVGRLAWVVPARILRVLGRLDNR
jgi:phosphohistidine phosphatase